jgi:(p)ppGpp synthase/HD superfamily hydrolase
MLMIKAINFMAKKHKGQTRRVSGLPYITHPTIVAHLIGKYKGDSKHLEELQITALLHDVIEDTDCDRFEIEREFGSMISSMVMELTNDTERIKEIGKPEYIKQKMVSMSKYAFILKLVDRLSNVMDEPSKTAIENTISLMDYLMKNRKNLTERQIVIMKEITNVCMQQMVKPK